MLIAMSVAFGLCIAGLVAGMAYDLVAVLRHHRTLEQVLGNSILFYKTLGGLGVVGLALLFAFLVASISGKRKQ